MSCTVWTENWGQSGLNGPYDEADMAYDSATRTYDGILYTVYTETSNVATSYTEDSDESTSYTEEWVLTTAGAYDDGAQAYDDSEETYDGVYFTLWQEDTDKSSTYMPKGLCIEILDTGGELLLDTGGDNLTWTSL